MIIQEEMFKTQEKEIWKDVKGCNGRYQVSNLGRVKSLPKKTKTKTMIMTGTITKIGYIRFNLSVNKNMKKHHLAHRLVAIAFLDNKENKRCVNHIDGNKINNRVENLEWCTHLENNRHAMRTGLNIIAGESNGQAKLTEKIVLSIRKSRSEGKKYREISELYGVPENALGKILLRRTWRHI